MWFFMPKTLLFIILNFLDKIGTFGKVCCTVYVQEEVFFTTSTYAHDNQKRTSSHFQKVHQ